MKASSRAFAATMALFVLFLHAANAQPFWQKTSGPVGASITCMSFGATGAVYAGTKDGCLYLSTNGGGSWSLIFTSGSPSETPITGAVETGGGVFVGSHYDQIMRSTDGGITWVPKTSGFATGGVQYLALNPLGTLFAAASNNVYRSTNFGEAWQDVTAGLPAYPFVTNLPIHPGGDLLVLTSGNGVYRSSDNGTTWSAVPGTGTRTVTAVGFPSGGIVFAGDLGAGIVRTTDNGTTWLPASNGVTTRAIAAFAFHPASSTLFVGTGDQGVFKWTESTQSWTACMSGLGSPLIGTLGVSGSLLAGTNGNGVYVSSDAGVSWAQRNAGFGCTVVNAITAANDNSVLAGTQYGGIYRSTNRGDSWIEVSGSIPKRTVPALVKSSTGTLYAGVDGSGVFRSSDNGSTWSSVSASLPGTEVRSLAVNASGHLFVGTMMYLYRSTNEGSSWDQITVSVGNVFINAITVAPNGHLFLACTFGPIYRSTDNGTSWQSASTGYGGFTASPIGVNTQGTLFTGSGNAVYRSTDDGGSWSKTATLPGTLFSSAQIRTFGINADSKVFAATSLGVFRSTDDGSSWTKTTDGLTDSSVTSLGFLADGTLLAGTKRQGVFRTTKTTTALGPLTGGTPLHFRLDQNYPNPFNPTTVVSYQLPVVGNVRLVVYDLIGREVAVLVNERESPGSYEVRFDATGLASGVYLYRMTVGNLVQMRKMALVR